MADTLEIFGTEYTNVTGIIATDSNGNDLTYTRGGGTPTLQTKSKTYTPTTSQQTESITADSGYDGLSAVNITVNAMPTGTAGTPTATKGTVSNHQVSVTPSVTNTAGYISGGTKTGTAVTVSASELVSGTYSVTSSGTKDVTNYASASVPSGTEGTPTATKGTVSNHSVSVTPSVTNTGGYITGGTKTGTAVTVTASELASGNKAITQNGTDIDVVGYSTVSVDVQGGGGYTWETLSDQNVTITADSPNPNYFYWTFTDPLSADETYRITWGTGGTQYICETKVDPVQFTYDGYYLGNAHIAGSSYADTGEPFMLYRNSATRMIGLTNHSTGSWHIKVEKRVSSSATLIEKTITANGTYDAEDDDADGYSSVTVNVSSSPTIQSLSITPSTSQQTFNASNVDGYKPVTVAAMTTMTLPTSAASSATSGYTSKATIGRSTAAQYINIPPGYNSTGAYYVISAVANGNATAPASISGTAASVSTGTNTLTLTKTVSVTPTVSAGYVSSGTAGNSSVSLTASVTTKAAATITPTTTNQTIAAGTYLTGTQTIAGDADLVGGNILSTANIFGVQGTVDFVDVYIRSAAPTSSVGSDGDIYIQE